MFFLQPARTRRRRSPSTTYQTTFLLSSISIYVMFFAAVTTHPQMQYRYQFFLKRVHVHLVPSLGPVGDQGSSRACRRCREWPLRCVPPSSPLWIRGGVRSACMSGGSTLDAQWSERGFRLKHAWYPSHACLVHTLALPPPVHESEQSEVSHELALPEPPVSPGASSVDFAVSERSSVGFAANFAGFLVFLGGGAQILSARPNAMASSGAM